MKLLLIRHGQSMGNAEHRMQGHYDTPLSELGRAQARLLAERLRREGWQLAALVASPLRRAAETAGIVATALEQPVTWDERLLEYDIGRLSGVVWTDVERLFPEVWQQLQGSGPVSYPGEEGLDVFQRRVLSLMADLRGRYQDDEVVGLVSHGGTLSMLICCALDIPPRRPQPFRLSNSSLSIVEFQRRGPAVSLLNDTHHLDGLTGDRPSPVGREPR